MSGLHAPNTSVEGYVPCNYMTELDTVTDKELIEEDSLEGNSDNLLSSGRFAIPVNTETQSNTVEDLLRQKYLPSGCYFFIISA